MRKLYRLWIPQADINGAAFDKLCQKCQGKIAKAIKNKLVLPTEPHIIIDEEVTLTLGYSESGSISGTEVTFCPTCTTTFKQMLHKLDYLHISNKPIELWIATLDESEKEGIEEPS